jgi:hypothetical protein
LGDVEDHEILFLRLFLCSSDENRLLLFWARLKLVPDASTNLQRTALEEESYEDINL